MQHNPLSLLYAAVDSIKSGFEINIVDVRLCPQTWKEEIASKISPTDTILLGISVMTGTPIKNALEISRWAKSEYPNIRVVWGGAARNLQRKRNISRTKCGFCYSRVWLYAFIALS